MRSSSVMVAPGTVRVRGADSSPFVEDSALALSLVCWASTAADCIRAIFSSRCAFSTVSEIML